MIFESGMGYFFHARFFQTSFVYVVEAILFCTKFTDFSDNIDLQEFVRPFGLFGLGLCNCLAPKGIITLDLEPELFSEVREALPILVFLLDRSSKPLHTEKAGSKGTGMASKVAQQE